MEYCGPSSYPPDYRQQHGSIGAGGNSLQNNYYHSGHPTLSRYHQYPLHPHHQPPIHHLPSACHPYGPSVGYNGLGPRSNAPISGGLYPLPSAPGSIYDRYASYSQAFPPSYPYAASSPNGYGFGSCSSYYNTYGGYSRSGQTISSSSIDPYQRYYRDFEALGHNFRHRDALGYQLPSPQSSFFLPSERARVVGLGENYAETSFQNRHQPSSSPSLEQSSSTNDNTTTRSGSEDSALEEARLNNDFNSKINSVTESASTSPKNSLKNESNHSEEHSDCNNIQNNNNETVQNSSDLSTEKDAKSEEAESFNTLSDYPCQNEQYDSSLTPVREKFLGGISCSDIAVERQPQTTPQPLTHKQISSGHENNSAANATPPHSHDQQQAHRLHQHSQQPTQQQQHSTESSNQSWTKSRRSSKDKDCSRQLSSGRRSGCSTPLTHLDRSPTPFNAIGGHSNGIPNNGYPPSPANSYHYHPRLHSNGYFPSPNHQQNSPSWLPYPDSPVGWTQHHQHSYSPKLNGGTSRNRQSAPRPQVSPVAPFFANKNRVLECDFIPSKKSKRKIKPLVDQTSDLREEIKNLTPLPGFQQAFGSTEIGRFSETFLNTPESPLDLPYESEADTLSPQPWEHGDSLEGPHFNLHIGASVRPVFSSSDNQNSIDSPIDCNNFFNEIRCSGY